MGNSGPKTLPTLRDPKDPQQLAVWMREVRELFRRVNEDLDSVQELVDNTSTTGGGSGVTLPIAESDVTNLVSDLAGKASSVHSHAEADVTGLTADLAAKALKSVTINISPGSGGGDLSANRTLVPATNSTSSAGIVPQAPNDVTQFWRGDAAWATQVGGGGLVYPSVEGDVTFDGTSTVLGLVPSSSEYLLTRDIICGTITVNSAIKLCTNGWRVYAHRITGAGIIHNDGKNGGVGTFGVGGTLGAGGGGGFPSSNGRFRPGENGGTGSSADGAASARILPAPIGVTSAFGGGGTIGPIAGGAGPQAFQGGGGGGGGHPTFGSQSGRYGSVTVDPIKSFEIPARLLSGLNIVQGEYTYGSGGGGGGPGDNGGFGGGGGGGGGGCCAVVSTTIDGTITIRANGGNGAAGTASTIGARYSSGGGGGGGGGLVIVIAHYVAATVTLQANGGSGGLGGALGSGSGAGAAGGDGHSGLVISSYSV